MTKLRIGAALTLLTAFLAGCPGSLSDPERFLVPYDCELSSTCTSTTTAPPAPPTALLTAKCALVGCHATASKGGGLDLEMALLEARIVGVTSSSAMCRDRVLVEPGVPEDSLLYQKLESPPCGLPMPPTSRLSADELEEVRVWIAGLTRRTQ